MSISNNNEFTVTSTYPYTNCNCSWCQTFRNSCTFNEYINIRGSVSMNASHIMISHDMTEKIKKEHEQYKMNLVEQKINQLEQIKNDSSFSSSSSSSVVNIKCNGLCYATIDISIASSKDWKKCKVCDDWYCHECRHTFLNAESLCPEDDEDMDDEEYMQWVDHVHHLKPQQSNPTLPKALTIVKCSEKKCNQVVDDIKIANESKWKQCNECSDWYCEICANRLLDAEYSFCPDCINPLGDKDYLRFIESMHFPRTIDGASIQLSTEERAKFHNAIHQKYDLPISNNDSKRSK